MERFLEDLALASDIMCKKPTSRPKANVKNGKNFFSHNELYKYYSSSKEQAPLLLYFSLMNKTKQSKTLSNDFICIASTTFMPRISELAMNLLATQLQPYCLYSFPKGT